jgi:hypothetical protein
MMNPFLLVPQKKTGKTRIELNEELAAQQYAQIVRNSGSHRNMGLWAGNLLIRIGKKLAEQDIEMQTSKEHA